MKRAAVFLDRDGTINRDPGYLSDPDGFELFPRSGEGMRLLAESGFTLVVVSNQSGIGRGLIAPSQLDEIHERMKSELRGEGVELEGIYYCPHHPGERCSCRKPSPLLVLSAAEKLGLDLASSYFVGDQASDILTGKNAGLRTVLVTTGEGLKSQEESEELKADCVAKDLLAAARWIIADRRGRSE